ncbi:thiamine-binding protein [Brachybacterium paraconglomeratum]|uniref:thiamine-binding protein n=1 Tax=Brachybacterium paraconglomeratum TaxID=173362 RepID=UPI0029398B61|nr:thiamine-binding protein [Brachybacterium paraconglomeratum]
MIVAFSVQPTGAPSDPALARDLGEGADAASVHDAVAAAVRIVRDSGLPTRTSSMFTEIEGEWDEVMDVVKRATDEAGRYGSRVSLVLKADIRPGHDRGELDGKIERMEAAAARLEQS